MRFFYAVIMFLISTFVIFWAYVFAVPTPRIYLTDDVKMLAQSDESDPELRNVLDRIRGDNKATVYYFEEDLPGKRLGALVLYAFISFVIIFFSVVLFHTKSYVMLPVIAATILCFVVCSMLWLLANTIPSGIYFDLMHVRNTYGGLRAFQFLSVYLFMNVFVLGVGLWYRIP
jgi:hypothetical protein